MPETRHSGEPCLARAPLPLALGIAIVNAVMTARLGTSTVWLPRSAYPMIVAGVLLLPVVWEAEGGRRQPADGRTAGGPTGSE